MKLGKLCLVSLALMTILFFCTKAQAAEGGVPVLLYHHILKKAENPFPSNSNIVSYEAFSEQMAYLYNQGYHTATLSELASYLNGAITLPPKTVVITFDDGMKTNYLYAYPVLKKYGFKAGNFLITNRISETPVPFNPTVLFQPLSWPEVNGMKDVFQYGSHTHGLHNLINGTSALISGSDQIILQDLETSRGLLNTDFLPIHLAPIIIEP
ncbi:polysaccharide deacetylase family protein [Paenibacillus sp. BSR1-1]|uniref:polysaccharide deacetylase family protein n=1 Tax=Paenibacillus sp. BSR1-1 TaxID=3020845 RepID=UPI0025B07B0D|nr:polysaccharide deacetylase family protein [Paenibacillus sp. BSR1-1]MDN3020128.1 polysaccharide deacetylase family protein [Paenibacillus sp. BSR1-1]